MSKSYFLAKIRKLDFAPTVMYCILSSITQENTHKSLQSQFTLIDYLLAVIYKVGTANVMTKRN